MSDDVPDDEVLIEQGKARWAREKAAIAKLEAEGLEPWQAWSRLMGKPTADEQTAAHGPITADEPPVVGDTSQDATR